MSYFAEIDSNGVVQRVIVSEQDFINGGSVGDPVNWIQTRLNPTTFRKQYAGPGYTYDKANDVFVGPKPYNIMGGMPLS